MSSLYNHYTYAPTGLKITRGAFDLSHSHKTSFNSGVLVPFKCLEVLPGDTFSLDQSTVCRMTTPIFPTMDNAYLDTFWFFVPTRLVWDHTKEFYGENTEGPWEPETEYTIPMSLLTSNSKGTLYHQLGIPIFDFASIPNGMIEVSDLPIRAYGLIWNEWFRNQNVSAPCVINKGDSGSVYQSRVTGPLWNDSSVSTIGTFQTLYANLGILLPVAKYPDRFTSCLPEPQKGPAVELPIVEDAPVYGVSGQPLRLESTATVSTIGGLRNAGSSGLIVADSSGGTISVANYYNVLSENTSSNTNLSSNLYADLGSASAISVNTMRQMFAMQRLYELDARSGTRFREVLKAHFGVTVKDERVQIPEYLAGCSVPISMTAVPQTSATTETSPQGNVSAYSQTSDKRSLFTFSATEPGFLMGLCCVRTNQTYSQGLHPMWSRKRRFDFYWPNFANLGETPVFRRELKVAAYDHMDNDLEVFGYQEAWSEYRFMNNTVSGMLDPAYDSTTPWTYAALFGGAPTLSEEFIYEDPTFLDRTLSVSSSVEDQFICDFYFNITAVRPMPVYSVPGLTSHF